VSEGESGDGAADGVRGGGDEENLEAVEGRSPGWVCLEVRGKCRL
jgi:hypothetical protein